jgi:tRNA(Ile2)-agmatinylcytidine synthase
VTVIGVDDTDSRERGMCTTYVAHLIAERLGSDGHAVAETLLVRLNPAVEHKTRGNAALAVHTDASLEEANEAARAVVADAAETADDRTQPGLVVAPGGPGDVPGAVAEFARAAVRDHHDLADAVALAETAGYRHEGWAGGRGRIGALAAVGADRAFDEWTHELIAYRGPERRGTERVVDRESLFAAADAAYPAAWDTVDRAAGEAVCVPHTPGPILYGIRGDDPEAVRAVVDGVDSEPRSATRPFRTNQGTDAHLREADSVAALRDGRAYRVDGTVRSAPETREGGHVFLAVGDESATVDCVAFEPTKRFRDRVRALRPGDRVTVCGEVSDGTCKLEKFAVRELDRTAERTPDCPDCGRSMESAGADQGYRCRDCGTSADGPETVRLDRDLELGWYEVPPRARRHVAKPLVRGGFDGAVHPER